MCVEVCYTRYRLPTQVDDDTETTFYTQREMKLNN